MPRQVWQAEDGTQFDNEEECLLYEKFFRNFGWQPKHSIDSSIKSFLQSAEKKHELDKLFNSRP